MFDRDQFIADCQAALDGDRALRNVRDVVARAVSDPGAVLRGLGEPTAGGVIPLYRSADLTILNVLWPAHAVIMPHNHELWAVIGVYGGREDNILWRRLPPDAAHPIEAAGAKSLCNKDVLAMGTDVIHSVINPIARVTGAIHVYGGDFYGVERSEWDPESLQERSFDMEKAQRLFAQ